jgi:hypothetical protein
MGFLGVGGFKSHRPDFFQKAAVGQNVEGLSRFQ